jgi:hypothetical protein
MRSAALGLAVALLAVWPVRADDELDSVLEGFDDPPQASAPSEPAAAPTAERAWEIDGELWLRSSVNYAHSAPALGAADYRGLSRLQAGMRLALDGEPAHGIHTHVSARGFRDFAYALKDRHDFTHEVRQTHEADFELEEAWVRGSPLPRTDLKIGRQIVAWGRSDTLRVLDVLNPIDEREPGLVDLSDMRLPVAMTRLDSYFGPLTATGIAIHESRQNKEPAPGSDFFPPLGGLPIPGFHRPGQAGNDTQWAAALGGTFRGWDASLHYASIFPDRPYLGSGALLRFPRTQLIGASGSVARGNWLLKGEIARRRGLRFASVQRRFARTDLMLGVEYSGAGTSFVALEIVLRQLHGFESRLERIPDFTRRTRVETALRYSVDLLHDSLHATLLAVVLGERAQDGTAYRASLAYDVRDAWSIEAGVLVFEEGDLPPLSAFDDNDRIFAGVTYSF